MTGWWCFRLVGDRRITFCEDTRKQEWVAVVSQAHGKTCGIFLFRRQHPTLQEAGLHRDCKDSIESFCISFTQLLASQSPRHYWNQEIHTDRILLINRQPSCKSHNLTRECPLSGPGFYTAISSLFSLASSNLHPKTFLFSRYGWVSGRSLFQKLHKCMSPGRYSLLWHIKISNTNVNINNITIPNDSTYLLSAFCVPDTISFYCIFHPCNPHNKPLS